MPSNLPPIWEVPEASKRNPYTILAQALESFPKYWMQMKMYTDAQKQSMDFKQQQLDYKVESDRQSRADNIAKFTFEAKKSLYDMDSDYSAGLEPPSIPEFKVMYGAYKDEVINSDEVQNATPEMQNAIISTMEKEEKTHTDKYTYLKVRSNVTKMIADPSKWYIPEEGKDFPTRLLDEFNRLDPSTKKTELEPTVMKALGTYNENMRKKAVYENMVEWQSDLYDMEDEHVENYKDINPNDIASKTTQWNQFAANWAGIKKLDESRIKDAFKIQSNIGKNLALDEGLLVQNRDNMIDNEILDYKENPDKYLQRPLDERLYFKDDGTKITIDSDEERWRQLRSAELLSQELILNRLKTEHLMGEMDRYNRRATSNAAITGTKKLVVDWEAYLNSELAKPVTEIKEEVIEEPPPQEPDAPTVVTGKFPEEFEAILNEAITSVLPDSLLDADGKLKEEFQNKPQIIAQYKDKINAEIKRLQEALPADTVTTTPADTTPTTPTTPLPTLDVEEVEPKAVKKLSSGAIKSIDKQIERIDKFISGLEERMAKAPNEKMKERIQNQIDRQKAKRDKLLVRKSGGVIEAKPTTDSNFRTYLEGLFSEPSEESIQAKARADKILGK